MEFQKPGSLEIKNFSNAEFLEILEKKNNSSNHKYFEFGNCIWSFIPIILSVFFVSKSFLFTKACEVLGDDNHRF